MAKKLELKKVDQIGIVVRDIDKVIESWSSLFGIGPWTFMELGGTDEKGRTGKARLAFAYLGSVQIELIQCIEGRIFHSDFLDKHGEGLHHLGFYVDDVNAEAANLTKQGRKVLSSMPGVYAYMDTCEPGGVIFEVIRRPQQTSR